MKTPSFKKYRYTISLIFTLFFSSLASTSLANDKPILLDLDTSFSPATLSTNISPDTPDLTSFTLYPNTVNDVNDAHIISLAKPAGKSILADIQDRFLTIHYGKTEKIKAVYAFGTYGIAYQQEW